MTILAISERSQELIQALTALWEESVRATHDFLSNEEILQIKTYVPQALAQIPVLLVDQDGQGQPQAFMGLDGEQIEMLFVAPDQRGQGLGKALVTYGIQHYGANQLTVNEQNPAAQGFYEHLGFETYKRTETDQQGQPYPLLYMRKSS